MKRIFLLMVILSLISESGRAQRWVAEFPIGSGDLLSAGLHTQADSLLVMFSINNFDFSIEKSRWIDRDGKVSAVSFPTAYLQSILATNRIGSTQYYYSVKAEAKGYSLICLAHDVSNPKVAEIGKLALLATPVAVFKDHGDLLLLMTKKGEFRLVVMRVRGSAAISETPFTFPIDLGRCEECFSYYDAGDVHQVDDAPGVRQLVRDGNFIMLIQDEPLPADPQGYAAKTVLARINLSNNTMEFRAIPTNATGRFSTTMAGGLLYRFVPEQGKLEVFSPVTGNTVDNYIFKRDTVVNGFSQYTRMSSKKPLRMKPLKKPFKQHARYILVDSVGSGNSILTFVQVAGDTPGSGPRLGEFVAPLSMALSPLTGFIVTSSALPTVYGATRVQLLGNGKYAPVGTINTAAGKIDEFEFDFAKREQLVCQRFVKSCNGFYGLYFPRKSKSVQIVYAPQ